VLFRSTTLVTPNATNIFCTPITVNAFQFDVSCRGGNDGYLSASASGGATPYVFNWSNGISGNILSNLTAGTYTVTVTDANSCDEVKSFSISQPTSAVNVSTTKQDQTNYNVNNGSATASGSGGTPGYSYSWSTGSSAATINNLAPGNYTVTITDANDCSDSESVTINPVNCVVSANVNHTDVSYLGANNGSATASGGGGPSPYSFAWSTGSSAATINNLAPGNYTVTVTAANGCFDVNSITIDEVNCSGFSLSLTKTNETYFNTDDGSATANPSGTAPYTYSWSNGGTTKTINNLSPGTYSVTAVDAVFLLQAPMSLMSMLMMERLLPIHQVRLLILILGLMGLLLKPFQL